MTKAEYERAFSHLLVEVFGKNSFSEEEMTSDFFAHLYCSCGDFFKTEDGYISLDLFRSEEIRQWLCSQKDEDGAVINEYREEDDEKYDDDEDLDPPRESLCYQEMCISLKYGLDSFIGSHSCPILKSFGKALYNDLERFSDGEKINEYDFTIAIRSEYEMTYIGFHIEEDMMEISKGGSIYDPGVCSDSYTDWEFSIWTSGCEDSQEVEPYNFCTIASMLCDPKAVFSIETPDEFCYASDEEH